MKPLTLLELLEKFGREVVHIENTTISKEEKDKGVKAYASTYRDRIIESITRNL